MSSYFTAPVAGTYHFVAGVEPHLTSECGEHCAPPPLFPHAVGWLLDQFLNAPPPPGPPWLHEITARYPDDVELPDDPELCEHARESLRASALRGWGLFRFLRRGCMECEQARHAEWVEQVRSRLQAGLDAAAAGWAFHWASGTRRGMWQPQAAMAADIANIHAEHLLRYGGAVLLATDTWPADVVPGPWELVSDVTETWVAPGYHGRLQRNRDALDAVRGPLKPAPPTVPAPERRAYRCDEGCLCPADELPMHYAPSTGQHACQDPDCEHAHPGGPEHG